MNIRFSEIRQTMQVKGICSICGKRRSRTISEWETVNPYNRHKNGMVKTRIEVEQSVSEKINAGVDRLSKYFMCKSCEGRLR